MLDWWHLSKRCRELTCLIGRDREARRALVQAVRKRLWQGEVQETLDLLEEYRPHARNEGRLDELIEFVRSREESLVNYRERRRERRYIGSGGVEKANELMDTIAVQGIAPAGPWLTHHLRMDPDTFDFEIAVPVTAPVAAAGRVKSGQLPAAAVARTVYHGPYEGLPDAWAEFMDWIVAEGHTPAQDLWERYVVGPESNSDPATWRTELNRPLSL